MTKPTDLFVPYEEKDEVKQLGARWDRERKCWYVPAELALEPFQKWLPPPMKPNGQYDDCPTVRSDKFMIVEVDDHRICWKCKEVTLVCAFYLPPGYERLNTNGGELHGHWEQVDGAVIIAGVTYINKNAIKAMQEIAKENYRLDYHHGFYWLNHCDDCGALLSDWYDHNEPEGAFSLDLEKARSKLSLYEFKQPFEAGADEYSFAAPYHTVCTIWKMDK
jgi:hypothetical protein